MRRVVAAAPPTGPVRCLPLPWGAAVALVLALVPQAGAEPAPAQLRPQPGGPVLHVRARTRLRLDALQRVDGGLVVRGVLLDQSQDAPLVGRTVAVAVDALDEGGDAGASGAGPAFFRYAEPTGEGGEFAWKLPLAPGRYTLRIAAQMGPDDDYLSSAPVERVLDLALRTPRLVLRAPEALEGRAVEARLAVEAEEGLPAGLGGTASGAQGPVELNVHLTADGRPLGEVRTQGGRGELRVPVAALGARGRRVLVEARFAGDPLRNPATASVPVWLRRPTALTLAIGDGPAAEAGAQRARALGGEVGLAPAVLHPDNAVAEDEPLLLAGELREDDAPLPGEQVALLATPEAGGPERLLTVVSTDAAGRFASRHRGSDLGRGGHRLEARHEPSTPARDPARTRALLITVTASPLRRWAYAAPPLATLILLGVPILARGLRRLAGALTRRVAQLEARVHPARARGSSAAGGASAGPQGRARSALGRPIPIRDRVFARFESQAAPRLPSPDLVRIWTPGEVAAHLARRTLRPEAAEQAGALVEEACYGREEPAEEVIEELERRLDQACRPSV